MRKASALSASILDRIAEYVVPGATTDSLDQKIHEWMTEAGATPATLGYRGYPKSSCISLNHVVCHGIPGEKKLKDGDILNIDVTCILDGWFGDTSRMYVAGKLSRKAERLIQVTYDSLMLGIEQVKPGNTFGDIGAAIQQYAEKKDVLLVHAAGNDSKNIDVSDNWPNDSADKVVEIADNVLTVGANSINFNENLPASFFSEL